MSLNKILLIGNLGADPEMRYTASGKPVASFRMATNRQFKVEGVLKKETDWFSVIAFGRLAEICSEFLKKGKPVFVEGSLHTRSWTDAQGTKHFRTEVIAQGLRFIGRRDAQPADNDEAESAPANHDDPF